jgi:DNA polymerase III subunit alpha
LSKKIPFVGLHAHSGLSLNDGLGYPQDHIDFALHNGSDALALTDHGHMNGLPYQVLHAKKLKGSGDNFKPIFGVEAYFLPSLEEWREEYERAKNEKKKVDRDISLSIEDESASKQKVTNILKKRNHLILLAQSQMGLNNIFKLVSESYKDGNFYRYPRMDYDLLSQYSDGVVAASACLGGVYAGNYWDNKDDGDEAVLEAMRDTTRRMKRIFGDRWFGELQWNNIPAQHELNKHIIKVCGELDVDLISTADSHYPNPDAWKDRELYKRIGWLGKGGLPSYMDPELPGGVEEIGYELYPKNGEQMWESYQKYSELLDTNYDDSLVRDSIERTHHIAHDLIEDFLPDNEVRLPKFVVPAGKTDIQALTEDCLAGLAERGLGGEEEYVERLKEELTTIKDRGFAKYFLTMKAIADKATSVQLTGPGRGSAAGSLVAYVLNITQIDPIKYGLLFSRFLRRDAVDYPDIDYDVSNPMDLKEILIEEWGDSTVVPISNYNTLQLRSLIKDVSKFYDIPFSEVNLVTGRMMQEATPIAKKVHGIKAGVYVPNFEEVMEYSDSLKKFLEKYPYVKTHIVALLGQVRSVSRHAGGVVIGENLDQWMPLVNSGGVRQTPWSEGQNVRHLEPLGFIKFDILGLASLRMIEDAVRHILCRHHGVENPTFDQVKDYYDEHLHPDKINLNDQDVYENIFHEGKWAGVFQFTEKGAQDFCKRAKPRSIIDISAITSIYRPGPLSAKVDQNYVEAKKRPSDVEYLHDMVRDVTKETYGFLIFQEQIALLAHQLGDNISLDEGNTLRKLLTKKGTGDHEKKKLKIYNKFVKGCVSKGLSQGDAEGLWQTFEYFSGYGFNKSHAVSYSILSYQCAYLLNYYPSEWMAAFLDKEPEKRKEKAINIAKSFGFNLEKLNVNTSGRVWEISEDGKTLIQPLTSIKGLGETAIEQILTHRPFGTIDDLLFREGITHSKLNKKALDVMCRAGALDTIRDDRFSGMKHMWAAAIADRPKNPKKLAANIESYRDEKDFSVDEKIIYLSELTGIFPMDLVLKGAVRRKLEENYIPAISDYDPDLQVVWFIPREIIKRKTKNGKTYWILNVVDSNNITTSIKCWGVRDDDKVYINRPYMAKLSYDEQWGFSTRSIRHNLRLLG